MGQFNKKYILIFVLIIILIGVLLLFISSNSDNGIDNEQLVTTPNQISPTSEFPPYNKPLTKLKFSPDPVYIDPDGTVTSHIVVDTVENRMTALRFEIKYDPSVLKYVSIEPANMLGGRKVFTKDIDEATGKIIFEAGVTPEYSIPIQTTNEALVKLVFRPIDLSSGQTKVVFLPGTYITAEGINKSALVEANELTIELKQSLTPIPKYELD